MSSENGEEARVLRAVAAGGQRELGEQRGQAVGPQVSAQSGMN